MVDNSRYTLMSVYLQKNQFKLKSPFSAPLSQKNRKNKGTTVLRSVKGAEYIIVTEIITTQWMSINIIACKINNCLQPKQKVHNFTFTHKTFSYYIV